MSTKIGSRVGAVCAKKDFKLELFGYGVYEGDFVPETEDVLAMGVSLKSVNLRNPKIKLDNGEVVWGCECWWGAEEKVKEWEKECTEVVIVSPVEYRKEYNGI